MGQQGAPRLVGAGGQKKRLSINSTMLCLGVGLQYSGGVLPEVMAAEKPGTQGAEH